MNTTTRIVSIAVSAVLLGACASGGGMYSQPYALFEPAQRMPAEDQRPAFVLDIDGKNVAINTNDPVEPGKRTVEKGLLFMFTTQGGVEIEQVAEESPDALVRLHLDPSEGFQPWVARRLVYGALRRRRRASRSRSPPLSRSCTARSSSSTQCSARSTR